jgi:hypothetical protein
MSLWRTDYAIGQYKKEERKMKFDVKPFILVKKLEDVTDAVVTQLEDRGNLGYGTKFLDPELEMRYRVNCESVHATTYNEKWDTILERQDRMTKLTVYQFLKEQLKQYPQCDSCLEYILEPGGSELVKWFNKSGDGHFCSLECYHIWVHNHLKEKWWDIECKDCGAKPTQPEELKDRYEWFHGGGWFCDWNCYNKWLKEIENAWKLVEHKQ